MAKESAEERRHSAGHRMDVAREKAKIAESAYDKEGYRRYRDQSLRAGNEALEANEEIKRGFGPNAGTARNQLRSNKARSQRALDEASRILSGGSQRSDQWQE